MLNQAILTGALALALAGGVLAADEPPAPLVEVAATPPTTAPVKPPAAARTMPAAPALAEAMPVGNPEPSVRSQVPPGGPIGPTVRIRDLARVQSVRSNQLVGYGIVSGLAGTGDSQQSLFTLQSVAAMLLRFGVTVDMRRLRTKNVAAVMVTADIPPFAKNGDPLDVRISAIGDATSLQGGELLQTPLIGADEEVYALAQGPISIGGFSAGGGGNTVTKNHPTMGRVPNGARVEKEIKTTLAETDGTVKITLHAPDFENASRVARAINEQLGEGTATPEDGSTVRVRPNGGTDLVTFLGRIQDLRVQPVTLGKVVMNERTGTVIIGGGVRIAPVAVAHGSLTVEVVTDFQVSQPEGFSKNGQTVVVPQTGVKAEEQTRAVLEFQPGATLAELVRALNALRVTPRDIIAIVQSIKEAGGLYAELVVQ